MSTFLLQDKNEIEFEKLKSKYNFSKIEFEGNKKKDQDYYLANSDNNEMERILNEDFFEEVIWHKINDKSENWIFMLVGIIISISVIFYFLRGKKEKRQRTLHM